MIVGIACSSTNGGAKLDGPLRAALDDPAALAHPLPFVTEKAPDGTTIVPLLIRSTDPPATIRAIVASGGSATAQGQTVIARLPWTSIRAIASRAEVTKIDVTYFDQAR